MVKKLAVLCMVMAGICCASYGSEKVVAKMGEGDFVAEDFKPVIKKCFVFLEPGSYVVIEKKDGKVALRSLDFEKYMHKNLNVDIQRTPFRDIRNGGKIEYIGKAGDASGYESVYASIEVKDGKVKMIYRNQMVQIKNGKEIVLDGTNYESPWIPLNTKEEKVLFHFKEFELNGDKKYYVVENGKIKYVNYYKECDEWYIEEYSLW